VRIALFNHLQVIKAIWVKIKLLLKLLLFLNLINLRKKIRIWKIWKKMILIFNSRSNRSKSMSILKSKKLMKQWDINVMFRYSWMFSVIIFSQMHHRFFLSCIFMLGSSFFYSIRSKYTLILRNSFNPKSLPQRHFVSKYGKHIKCRFHSNG
jgi:hypothetical protein